METYREALTQPLKWKTFEEQEEEALSLPNPSAAARSKPDDGATHDFEFWISARGGLLPTTARATMCSADEVFFQGQILPLRSSASTDDGAFGRGPSRCFSQSDCVDRCFAADRSSSSSSVSRSHSSNSTHSISGFDPPQPSSRSSHFCMHPSPKPHLRGVKRRSTGRRSTSSAQGAGWGIFRLGVVGAPQIELYDLKSRRRTKSGSGYGARRSNADASHADKFEKKVTATSRLVGLGLSCKCSPVAAEPIPPGAKVRAGKKKEEGVSLGRESNIRRNRLIGWLEELSFAKVTGRRDS